MPGQLAVSNMIEGQVRPNKVTDPAVLEALRSIPRDRFVPTSLRSVAYADEALPLGKGRWLPDAMTVARLLQAAEVGPDDVVLDIGGGYTAALLGMLAGTVVGIDTDDEALKAAQATMQDIGIHNVVSVHRDVLAEGYAEQGPYNLIFIGAGVARVPTELTDQLAENGRLATVLCEGKTCGKAVLYRKVKGQAGKIELFDASLPVLAGFEREETFKF